VKKPERCYICSRVEKKNAWNLAFGKPAKFFFLTTVDYEDHDPGFDLNNPPDYTDAKKAVACCNDHVEELKLLFHDELMQEVPYEEWLVASVMTT
jgi:hypothetical protein